MYVLQIVFDISCLFFDFNRFKLFICVLAFNFMIYSICQIHVWFKIVINSLGLYV